MRQTQPTTSDVKKLAKERRANELLKLFQRAERENKRAWGTDDMGRVSQIRIVKRDTKAQSAGSIACQENVILVCLEGDSQWQPLPGYTPSAERKKADVARRKSESKEKAERDIARSAVIS